MAQSDMVKAAVVQGALAVTPGSREESQLDLFMQSLMIDDTDFKRILKGEIHEPLNRLNQLYVFLSQRINLLLENPTNLADASVVSTLSQIKTVMEGIREQEAEIFKQLESYHEYVPYLLLASPSTVLSNISVKEADAIWRKTDIMLMRSKLKSKYKGRSMDSRNFFDALGIALFLKYRRAIEAHTFDGLVRERKEVQIGLSDRTSPEGKRRWRLF